MAHIYHARSRRVPVVSTTTFLYKSICLARQWSAKSGGYTIRDLQFNMPSDISFDLWRQQALSHCLVMRDMGVNSTGSIVFVKQC